MSNLVQKWKHWSSVINELEYRERRLLTITLVVVISTLFLFVAWLPLFESWQKHKQQLYLAEAQGSEALATINRLKLRASVDANAPYRNQIKSLRQQVANQESQIANITSALITPKNMNQVFAGLLNESELKLHSIKNQDAVVVALEGQSDTSNLLYKHGLSLNLKGQFLNGLKYVQRLEQQDWQLYWDELIFTTEQYPNGQLEINAHTLSTSDSVLGL